MIAIKQIKNVVVISEAEHNPWQRAKRNMI